MLLICNSSSTLWHTPPPPRSLLSPTFWYPVSTTPCALFWLPPTPLPNLMTSSPATSIPAETPAPYHFPLPCPVPSYPILLPYSTAVTAGPCDPTYFWGDRWAILVGKQFLGLAGEIELQRLQWARKPWQFTAGCWIVVLLTHQVVLLSSLCPASIHEGSFRQMMDLELSCRHPSFYGWLNYFYRQAIFFLTDYL